MDHLCPESRCCVHRLTREIGMESGSFFVQTFNLRDFIIRKADCSWPMVMFFRDGFLFAVCSTKSGDYYHFTVVMFGSAEACSAINMEIEVYEKSSSPSPDRQSAKLRCKPCSIDETKSDMKHLGLTVYHKVMENMVLRGEGFKFTVRITFF